MQTFLNIGPYKNILKNRDPKDTIGSVRIFFLFLIRKPNRIYMFDFFSFKKT